MTEPRPERIRPVTATYLERAAVSYLERYVSSSENLRRVLMRKARRRLAPDSMTEADLAAMVGDVVERVVRTGLVDDARYAEMKVASLVRRGTSLRGMSTRIRQKGVSNEDVAAALAEHAPDERALARRFAQRKRLGPWRSGDPAPFRDRDMAAFGRAGFSYGIARAVLEGGREDEPET